MTYYKPSTVSVAEAAEKEETQALSSRDLESSGEKDK